MFGSVAKDLVRYLPGQVAVAIIAFISVPILTRVLAPTHYGHFALVASSVAVALIVFGCLPMGIIRFYPAAREGELEILVRSAVWAQVVSVLCAAVGVFIVCRFVWPYNLTVRPFVDVAIWIVAAQCIFAFLVETLRANRRVGEYNAFTIWSKSVGLVTGVMLAVHFDLGVFGILWGIVLGFASALPFVWRRVFVDMRAIGPLSFSLVGDMVRFGIPLVIGNLGAWVLKYFDRYLIHSYFGAHDVGIYSAAYSISEHSIGILATLFMLSSSPLIANVWEKNGREASQALFIAVTRLYLLIAIPAVVGLSVLAEPVLTVLTGAAFSVGYSVVPWVVAGGFFLGLQHRFNEALRLVKRTPEIMFWIILSGVVNVILNWTLLPTFGYQIAAVNTLISYVLLCVGQAWSSRRYFRWPFPWQTALRSSVAAAVMFVGVYVLKHAPGLSGIEILCLGIPTGMVIYVVSVWLLGEVTIAELKTLPLLEKVPMARETSNQ